jgi:amphi-Trp domain-containing protein
MAAVERWFGLHARITDPHHTSRVSLAGEGVAASGSGTTRSAYVDRRQTRGDNMDLFDISETHRLRREEAAGRLHAVADALARNNSVEFERAGRRISVQVPDEVNLKVEVELGDENELEIELTW